MPWTSAITHLRRQSHPIWYPDSSKARLTYLLNPNPTKSTLSDTEKALKAWNSGKRLKDSFPILRRDSNYHTWRIEFVSEVKVQRMTRLINQQFNPSTIHDPYD